MELVDFLRARLDEDEAVARAATPGPWWYNPGKQWLDPEAFEKYDLAKGEEFVGYGGPHPFTGAVCATGPASHSQSMADAAHIARAADPARVLAEVDAKRRLLEALLGEGHAVLRPGGSTQVYCDADYGTDSACECGRDERVGQYLRLLALPYADRPGYRDEWRP